MMIEITTRLGDALLRGTQWMSPDEGFQRFLTTLTEEILEFAPLGAYPTQEEGIAIEAIIRIGGKGRILSNDNKAPRGGPRLVY
jgi:hypothetical protein